MEESKADKRPESDAKTMAHLEALRRNIYAFCANEMETKQPDLIKHDDLVKHLSGDEDVASEQLPANHGDKSPKPEVETKDSEPARNRKCINIDDTEPARANTTSFSVLDILDPRKFTGSTGPEPEKGLHPWLQGKGRQTDEDSEDDCGMDDAGNML